MSMKKRPQALAAIWFLCLLVCLSLIIFGIFYLANYWKSPNWLYRNLSGGGLLLFGLILGYYATVRFFWLMAAWLAKNDHILRNGRNAKGPKIVVIGGGTGLGTILRGLKEITDNLTAIVTVADDGGSSGRLRQEFGILPPGDIRNCLVAMADIEPLMERLMQYRFAGESVLAGHNFGNLFLTAMTDVAGDFVEAIKESSKVLAVRGQVLPATLEHVVLKAELIDGSNVVGESSISKSSIPIRRVFLEPAGSKPVAEAITAIKDADLIVLGPGSLYTSIIPNLLVEEIANTIRAASASKIYICNAMTQSGETDNYKASDHLKAIMNHAGPGLVDIAIINTETVDSTTLSRYAEEGAGPVEADLESVASLGVTPLGARLIHKSGLIRHDAAKLAELISGLYRAQKIGHAFGRRLTRYLYRFFRGVSGLLFIKLP